MTDAIALCADPAERARPIEILSAASIAPGRPDPTLLEIDPRPCELCGLTVDRHEMVDDEDGPIFYCVDLDLDELTLEELERRAELRRQEDIAAIIAWMDATDSPAEILPIGKPPVHRPAVSTIAAFRYLVAMGDVAHLKGWLGDRPKDAPLLLALLESPSTC
jgi:hypothetical protein